MKKIVSGSIALVIGFLLTCCTPTETPEVMVTEITILPSTPVSIYVNEITLLTAIAGPTYASDKRVTWESLHPAIATIDAHTGLVTGVSAGTATMVATAIDGSGVTEAKLIQVSSAVILVAFVTITPLTPVVVAVGDTTTLGVTYWPNEATQKEVRWISHDPDKAIVDPVTGLVTGISPGFATIRATSQDARGVWAEKTIAVISGIEEGVEINGVMWATRNVDAVGTFAASQESSGMFYQWNRKVAWPTTGNVVGWDVTFPGGTTWSPTNDPSPAGWRVPTKAELEKLLDVTKVDGQPAIVGGVVGRRYTDIATQKSIFLPTTGFRGENGAMDGVLGIYYWSANPNGANGYYLGIGGTTILQGSSRMGFPIRPVKQ